MKNKKDNIILCFIWGITFLVYAIVIILHYLPQSANIPVFAKHLPMLNAILNGTAFVFLILAYVFIKKKNIYFHKICTLTACVLSIIFLLSYVLYHYLCGDSNYGGAYEFLFGFIWSTIISFLIFFTRAFEGYALSSYKYFKHINFLSYKNNDNFLGDQNFL